MVAIRGNLKFFGLLFILLSGQFYLVQKLRGFETSWIEVPEVDKKWDPYVYRLMSFGHLPLVIDWLFVKSLTDVTLSRASSSEHTQFYYDIDLISELDPRFFENYYVGGNLLTIAQKDHAGAKNILHKADDFIVNQLSDYSDHFREQYWINTWQLPLLLGYVYLFGLDDIPHASIYYRKAASFPSSPAYLAHFEQRLKAPGGEYEVGLKLLGFMIETASTPETKRLLERKRKDLFIGQYLYELNHSFLAFLKLQPAYARSNSISERQIKLYLKEFLRRNQISEQDPWGGRLELNGSGRITTTVPHEIVFGLRNG